MLYTSAWGKQLEKARKLEEDNQGYECDIYEDLQRETVEGVEGEYATN